MRQANIDVVLTEERDRGKTTTQVHKGSRTDGMFQSSFLHKTDIDRAAGEVRLTKHQQLQMDWSY